MVILKEMKPLRVFQENMEKEELHLLKLPLNAQENYLQQFFKHINPYTKLTYKDDPNVIAIELNNEPSHSGPKTGVTDYINRLAAAVRSTAGQNLFIIISANHLTTLMQLPKPILMV